MMTETKRDQPENEAGVKMKGIMLDSSLLGLEVMNAAIENVQEKIVTLSKLEVSVAPMQAWTELRHALCMAADLVNDLSPENFEISQILKQRRRIRKGK